MVKWDYLDKIFSFMEKIKILLTPTHCEIIRKKQNKKESSSSVEQLPRKMNPRHFSVVLSCFKIPYLPNLPVFLIYCQCCVITSYLAFYSPHLLLCFYRCCSCSNIIVNDGKKVQLWSHAAILSISFLTVNLNKADSFLF